jgi:sodium/potassium-transporting ATPase subunit alpha
VALWQLTVEAVYQELQTSPAGLSAEEARARLARYGPNSLQEGRGPSLLRRLAGQLTHFLALLFWLAAGLAFIAHWVKPGEGMNTLGWAIVGVIVINAAFSFFQEYRAERAVQALRRLLPAAVWVLRDGQMQQVSRPDLVPGDLLLLEEGEQVPADARLVEAVNLRVDNSCLTGESRPKRRTAEVVTDGHAPDIANLVFAGTTVLSGHGRAVVYATGMQTEFGKITRLATTVGPQSSPLEREIAHVTRVVALLSLAMGTIVFLIGLWMGLGLWVSSIFGIGIIAANVPEGLLPTVTLALAMGSQRMAARKALIKHLPAVETLGCTTVICTDKTGTLTENRMQVSRLYVDGAAIECQPNCLRLHGRLLSAEDMEPWRPLIDAITLCNNAKRVRKQDGRPAIIGDPTEVALMEFALDHGLLHGRRQERMGELPFDADRKRMSTLHWIGGRLIAYVKGAPELLLPLCTRVYRRGGTVPMTTDDRAPLEPKPVFRT